jgi:hypothetical protein
VALLVTLWPAPWSSGQTSLSKSDTSSARLFAEPVLVKGSPINLRAFDVSWNDNSTHKYYLADRTNGGDRIPISFSVRAGRDCPETAAIPRRRRNNTGTRG